MNGLETPPGDGDPLLKRVELAGQLRDLMASGSKHIRTIQTDLGLADVLGCTLPFAEEDATFPDTLAIGRFLGKSGADRIGVVLKYSRGPASEKVRLAFIDTNDTLEDTDDPDTKNNIVSLTVLSDSTVFAEPSTAGTQLAELWIPEAATNWAIRFGDSSIVVPDHVPEEYVRQVRRQDRWGRFKRSLSAIVRLGINGFSQDSKKKPTAG